MKAGRWFGGEGVFGASGAAPSAVVVLLHGGPEISLRKPWRADPGRVRLGAFVPSIQHAVSRMRASASDGEHASGFSVAVVRVRYEVRGWNGAARSPVANVEKALQAIQAEVGPVPVALVGHSMGGRVAAVLAQRPEVAVVVGLAPWWPDDEARHLRAGQSVLVLHGRGDRVVDPESTRRQVLAARGRGVAADWVGMPGGHGMVSSFRSWHALTADFVVSRLFAAWNPKHSM